MDSELGPTERILLILFIVTAGLTIAVCHSNLVFSWENAAVYGGF